MLKTLSYYIELSLITEGFLFLPKILLDRFLFHCFFKYYYARKFKKYGKNIYWGKYLSRKVIPSSIRISNPHLIAIEDNCQIEEGVYLQANPEGQGIYIGKGCRLNAHTHVLAGDKIELAEKVLVAPFVLLSSLNHEFSQDRPIMDQLMKNAGPIIIGSGCWIGQRATVLGGTQVKPNSVIAAQSIVKKKFEERGVVAGPVSTMVKTL